MDSHSTAIGRDSGWDQRFEQTRVPSDIVEVEACGAANMFLMRFP